LSSLIRNLM